MARVRLDLVVMMWSTLKSQENRKIKKLSQLEKSKSEKMSKSQNLAKVSKKFVKKWEFT